MIALNAVTSKSPSYSGRHFSQPRGYSFNAGLIPGKRDRDENKSKWIGHDREYVERTAETLCVPKI